MIARTSRFRALSRTDRALVLEAAGLLTCAWLGVRCLRYSTLCAVLEGWAASTGTRHHGSEQHTPEAIARVVWATNAVSRRLPAFGTCLVEALAAHAMLRRRGLPSEMRFGVRTSGSQAASIVAHAWVECGGVVVVGGDRDLPEYAVLSATGRS